MVVVVSAVEHVVVGLRPGAVDTERPELRYDAAGAGVHSGHEHDELDRVPAVQGQFRDAAFVDDLRQGGVRGLDLGDRAFDSHHFGHLADLEGGGDLAALVRREAERARRERGESITAHLHPVRPDWRPGKVEPSLGIRLRGLLDARQFIDGQHVGARNDGAGPVLCRSEDQARGLAERADRKEKPQAKDCKRASECHCSPPTSPSPRRVRKPAASA